MNDPRWRTYRDWLQQAYGERVHRIGLDGGFSCPNRGSLSEGGCVYCDALGSAAAYQRVHESRYTRSSEFVEGMSGPRVSATLASVEERIHSVVAQIEHGSAFIDNRYPGSSKSLYFQAFTSTYGAPGVLKRIYDAALDTGTYRELIVSTRPDCLSPEIVELLQTYKKRLDGVWVEVGLQSASDTTLRRINRGHDVASCIDACKRLSEAGLYTGLHVIFGLPGETLEDLGRTALLVCKIHPHAVKIHNLHVTASTRLFDQYREGELTVPCRDRHLSEVIWFLQRIPADIAIQRFVSDTPMHRLAAPRGFGDKGVFARLLQSAMEEQDVRQGDLV